MHRYTGPFPFDYENGYRIWKCHSPRDTDRLISGHIVWVQWDNRDWKRLRYDCQSGDFYVEHGGVWHPFWCLKRNRESILLSQPTEKRDDWCCSMQDSFSMDMDQKGMDVVETETSDDQRRNFMQLDNGDMMGRKRSNAYNVVDEFDADDKYSIFTSSKRIRTITEVVQDRNLGTY